MLKKIMNEVKELLADDMTDVAYKTWIRDLKIVDVKEGVYLLRVDHAFTKAILEDRYKGVIEEAFSSVEGSEVRVKFVFQKNRGKKKMKTRKANDGLNEYLTFENFVVDNNNRFAYDVLKMTCESSLRKYNPIVIYGRNGTGKTHLLQAVQNYYVENAKNRQSYYYSVNTFGNILIQAAEDLQSLAVQERFQTIDILMLDDFQFCKDKTWLQEYIYHLITDRTLAGKQVIIAIDREVNELGLNNWLQCRLEQGLLLEVKPCGNASMHMILQHMAEELGMILSKEVRQYLIENYGSNMMVLKGCLAKLEFISNVLEREITVSFCQEIL